VPLTLVAGLDTRTWDRRLGPSDRCSSDRCRESGSAAPFPRACRIGCCGRVLHRCSW
jgi:hypothetical protein